VKSEDGGVVDVDEHVFGFLQEVELESRWHDCLFLPKTPKSPFAPETRRRRLAKAIRSLSHLQLERALPPPTYTFLTIPTRPGPHVTVTELLHVLT